MKQCIAILMMVASLSRIGTAQEEIGDPGLVGVLVTHQQQNPYLPWKSGKSANRNGYGIFISSNRVLTTEHLVRNHTLVEIRRPREGEKITATVEIADHRLNLAILQVEAGTTHAIPPVPLAPRSNVDDQVTIFQIDADNDIQAVEASVSRIGVSHLSDAPYSLLTYQLLSDLNIRNEGAPVVKNGALIGIVMAYDSGTRIAVVISHPFIPRFVEDAATLPYKGPASAGFVWRALLDPAKRRFLGVDDIDGGIQVISATKGTPSGDVLRSSDVILTWGGHTLDNLGYYEDSDYGRLELSHLVKGRGSPGETVPVTIVREGDTMEIDLVLSGDLDPLALVPENVRAERAEYLVEGGLIIRDLDVFFMRARGGDWRSKVDSRLLHFYHSGGGLDHEPGDRVVILTGVLPDPINDGYHNFRNEVLTTVNGQHVRNMTDVFRIADEKGSLTRFTLYGTDIELVLDCNKITDANLRLSESYRIPELRFEKQPPTMP
jgi:S1-C subfamily serine protease